MRDKEKHQLLRGWNEAMFGTFAYKMTKEIIWLLKLPVNLFVDGPIN